MKLAPRLPYSPDQEIPTQPAACIVFLPRNALFGSLEPALELRMKCRVLEGVGEVHCGFFY